MHWALESAKQVAVDAADTGDHPVGGGALDQLVNRAAAALRGDHQGRVLDEGAGVAEVLDILAGGALAGFAAARDGVGPGGVEADFMALANLGEIGADAIEIDGFGGDRRRRPGPRTPR